MPLTSLHLVRLDKVNLIISNFAWTISHTLLSFPFPLFLYFDLYSRNSRLFENHRSVPHRISAENSQSKNETDKCREWNSLTRERWKTDPEPAFSPNPFFASLCPTASIFWVGNHFIRSLGMFMDTIWKVAVSCKVIFVAITYPVRNQNAKFDHDFFILALLAVNQIEFPTNVTG